MPKSRTAAIALNYLEQRTSKNSYSFLMVAGNCCRQKMVLYKGSK